MHLLRMAANPKYIPKLFIHIIQAICAALEQIKTEIKGPIAYSVLARHKGGANL